MKPLLSASRHPSARRSPPGQAALARRSAKREGAFTLVELIAVITIIGIVAASVIGAVVYAGKRAARAATKGLFERLSVAITMYREDYGAYPPDRNPNWPGPDGWEGWYMDDPPAEVRNLNQPAETLWYFLTGIYLEPRGNSSGDVIDDDEFQALARKTAYMDFREQDLRRTGIEFWMAGTSDKPDNHSRNDTFPEIVDAWGTPIFYIAKDNFNSDDPRGNEELFDLVSRGPDRRIDCNENNYDTRHGDEDKDNIANFPFE